MPEKEEFKATSEMNEYIGIFLRLVFLVFVGVGFVFSIACLSGCDMFTWESKPPPAGVEDERPDNFKMRNITIAEIGLFEFNPNLEGCRSISDDFDQLSWQFTMAQVCAPLATILSGVACGLLLVDLCLCRFACSRLLISGLFVAAFVSQTLTMLVYTAEVCEPSYVNGPYPCSPDTATWFSVVAIVIFLLCCLMACCVPKPVPLCIRIKEYIANDQTDSCFALCAKKQPQEEKEGEEIEAEEGEEIEVKDGEETEVKEQQAIATAGEIQVNQTHAVVITALTTARHGKLEEIEKELVLLEKYKDHMSEEEYDKKVAKLMAALPDPENYDEFTKTDALVVLKEPEVGKGEKEEEEGREGAEEEEEPSKEQAPDEAKKPEEAAETGGATEGMADAAEPPQVVDVAEPPQVADAPVEEV